MRRWAKGMFGTIILSSFLSVLIWGCAPPQSSSTTPVTDSDDSPPTIEVTEQKPQILVSDNFSLEPFSAVPNDEYPDLQGYSIYPWLAEDLRDYGYYFSDYFYVLEPDMKIEILCHSNSRICTDRLESIGGETVECDCDGGLRIEMKELMKGVDGKESGVTMSLSFSSCEVTLLQDGKYETRLTSVQILSNHRNLLQFTNNTEVPVWCDFTVSAIPE
jgi:hypothetical protein